MYYSRTNLSRPPSYYISAAASPSFIAAERRAKCLYRSVPEFSVPRRRKKRYAGVTSKSPPLPTRHYYRTLSDRIESPYVSREKVILPPSRVREAKNQKYTSLLQRDELFGWTHVYNHHADLATQRIYMIIIIADTDMKLIFRGCILKINNRWWIVKTSSCVIKML